MEEIRNGFGRNWEGFGNGTAYMKSELGRNWVMDAYEMSDSSSAKNFNFFFCNTIQSH